MVMKQQLIRQRTWEETDEEGGVIYRGIQIFSTNPTGKVAFMDNLVGLYVYEDNPDGTRKSGKIWEWK